MYLDYIRERQPGKYVIQEEHGFCVYSFTDDDTAVYIEEIYVKPEFRKSGLSHSLRSQVEEIARQKGCITLLGTVVPSCRGATTSIKVLLGNGLKLLSAENDLIWFFKEL